MNRDNIQSTINILRRAKNFNICSFQGNGGSPIVVKTEEELHQCGNSACIAGYIAVSPEWHALGNTCTNSGAPDKPGSSRGAAELMAEFWGVPDEVASAIVFGDGYYDEDNRKGIDWFEVLEQFGVSVDDVTDDWEDLTKEEAVLIFERMLEMA